MTCSIGSLGKQQGMAMEVVQNVTVKTAWFTGTTNGLRIKTWARAAARGAYVRGVAFEHATMRDVRNPIIIDQNYCPNHGGAGCPHQSSAVKISDVRYTDIQGSSASQVAVKFDCSASNPCTGIDLQDIRLTLDGGAPAEATLASVPASTSIFVASSASWRRVVSEKRDTAAMDGIASPRNPRVSISSMSPTSCIFEVA